MGAKFYQVLPVLLIDVVGGLVGFALAIVWCKVTGRELDRDTVLFLAKMFGGIALFGMLLVFIM